MRYNDYVVRFIDGNGRTKEKSFKDEDARAEFLDKNDVQVLSFSDPQ
jgi:hypothetical protein